MTFLQKNPIWKELAVSLLTVVLVSVASRALLGFIDYHAVALILLFTVSVLAMLLDIIPVLVAATLTALIWNFVFIPPKGTFFIGSTQDILMFLMYFVVTLINAVLMHRIRQMKKRERDKEEREKIIRLYNTLFNSLSHELLTPLATIIGSIDTIHENKERLSAAQHDELIAEIGTASIRLNGQLENLLSMSRLESGVLKPKTDWCDVNELVFSVIHDLSGHYPEHRIRFDHNDRLPLFKIDQGLMNQVIRNILHNSLIHTPANTLVAISASISPENHLVLVISDNGLGFPEKEIPFVFDKFYRLSSSTGGTGLGLSIAKGFCEAHNGRITLKNNPRGGACFTIELPAETSFLNETDHEQG